MFILAGADQNASRALLPELGVLRLLTVTEGPELGGATSYCLEKG